jgi:DNA polymerase III alpha subunit (gram-positive type)
MRQPNLIYWDLETTGLDLGKCQVTQIAAVAINGKTLSFTKNDIFSSFLKIETDPEKCKELDIEPLTEKIMKLTNTSMEDVTNAPTEEMVYEKLKHFVSRYATGGGKWNQPVSCGYNIRNYDTPIINRIASKYNDVDKNGNCSLFHCSHMIDLKDLMYLVMENIPSVNSISFDNMRQIYGMSSEGAHTASVDCIQGALLLSRKLSWLRKLSSRKKFEGTMADVNINDYL